MRRNLKHAAIVVGLLVSKLATAEPFPKVDTDLAECEAAVQEMKAEFAKVPGDSSDKGWVKEKLKHMVELDQHLRNFWMSIPHEHQYTPTESDYFYNNFLPRLVSLDQQNTAALKVLLRTHSWFTISKWGKAADSNAWLLVQHADQDREFQKEVLAILEKLYPSGETSPDHYAYLFDRVATSANDPKQRQLQRYGTQGQCVAPGKWEPYPIEDEDNVDLRRAAVGLPPLSEYIAAFKDICK